MSYSEIDASPFTKEHLMFKIELGDLEQVFADLPAAEQGIAKLKHQGYLGRAYLYEQKSATCWSLRERICLR